MKNKHYFLFGAVIVASLFIGGLVGKQFSKVKTITLYDTTIIHTVDTVLHEVILPAPIPDTFYVQEIFYDTLDNTPISLDTLEIINDYFLTREYSDTLLNNDKVMVHLSEKIRFNKVNSRILNYKFKYTPELIVKEKKNIRLYIGGEIGANVNGLSEVSLGFGIKDKKDRFYNIRNNFVDGLGWDIGVGFYIPITK